MKKILDCADKITTWTAVGMFVALALILTVNIIARLFSGGISWYMESAQFLNIWGTFIACIGLCAANDHLRIDAIEGVLKGQGKRWIRVVITVFTVIFFIMLGVSFVLLASKSKQAISTMQSLKLSYVYWPIPVFCFISAALTALRGIYDFLNFGKEDSQE